MEGIHVVTQDFVNVLITKSDSEDGPPVERRFKKGITIQDFKTKLELVTGGSAATMKLKVYDSKNNYICDIDNDEALLGSYHIDDGSRIHVIDKFVLCQDFTATDSTDRFQLSEEEYGKKGDTLRSFLQNNRLGKYNEEEMAKIKEQQQKELEDEANASGMFAEARVDNFYTIMRKRCTSLLRRVRASPDIILNAFSNRLAEAVVVGARCEVRVPQQGVRRGTVRYNGQLDGARGLWIGVQYDEPRGKNDGSVNGKRYFTCPPKYGGFVKPVYVTVGEFPEEEFDLEDEI